MQARPGAERARITMFAEVMLLTHVPYVAVIALLIVALLRLRGQLRSIRRALEVQHGQHS